MRRRWFGRAAVPNPTGASVRDMEDWEKNFSPFDMLWVQLDRVMHAAREGSSILERLATPPWDHDDPLIIEAWRAITHPDNLHHLLARLEHDMNPVARESTERALADCRKRIADRDT